MVNKVEKDLESDVFKDRLNSLKILSDKLTVLKWIEKHAIVFLMAVALIALCSAAAIMINRYSGRAAPGTNIAGMNVSGQNALAIRNSINSIENKIQLTFSYQGKTIVAHGSDLGIQVDIDKTTNLALITEQNWLNRVNIFATHNIKLVAMIDKSQIEKFLDTSFPELIAAPPQNAGVIYDKKLQKFVTQASVDGKVIDMDKIYSIVADLVEHPRAALCDVAIIDSKAPISDTQAQSAADYANTRLASRINLQIDGQTIYFPDPVDVADWTNFAVNNGAIDVSFDKPKIATFVKNVVAQYVPGKPVPETDIVSADGNTVLKVISAGTPGRVVNNIDNASGQVFSNLQNATSANIALETTTSTAPAKKVVAPNNHWIEANLSDYSVKLYDGSNVTWSTTNTSHGKPSMPTITGLFTVFQKTGGNDTGTNDYQDAAVGTNTRNPYGGVCMPNPGGTSAQLCSIHYVTYWGPGGYAFHEAWWLLSGGQGPHTAISHGCINMFKAEAKIVYDFSVIGTPVWVHY